MNKQKNPKAFPLKYNAGMQVGMTLRDYFAGQVITGIMGDYETKKELANIATKEGAYVSQVTAEQAYSIADAMLKVRVK